jgi:hypothetical protein
MLGSAATQADAAPWINQGRHHLTAIGPMGLNLLAQRARMLVACMPFWPRSVSNSTCWPS